MAVKIRLSRAGSTKRPFYRIVAADEGAPRDGGFLERLGTYDPRTNPPTIKLDASRVSYWLGVGARATTTVARILRAAPA